MRLQPCDLLDGKAEAFADQLKGVVEVDRLLRLVARESQLARAFDHWQSFSLWVVSPTDNDYPQRLKERFNDLAPPLIYGCGDASVLGTGGLAVVGSREVDPIMIEYTESVGSLAAAAKKTIVSGGARGIDQSAMRGALANGGKSIGVLADSLERSATNREHRNFLDEGQLVLISPYDPAAGFNIGHAMHRNKLIYALSDAALVVNSDFEKGGTWSGAVEQLEKLRFVPVYVRMDGDPGEGLNGLRNKGAKAWPNPSTPEALIELLEHSIESHRSLDAQQLSLL
jgi:predicted Rossmann fold nucleotide-binding protein DprA/Smf involved in DNA uptake